MNTQEDRVVSSEVDGGYHRVTFKREGLIDETCERCPCLSVCERGVKCVKDTAYVTEELS